MAIGAMIAPRGRARTQDAAPLKFEVAAIKPAKGDGAKGGLEILPGGGLRLGGVTLKQLIALAYDVRDNRVTGGPAWLGSDTFDILAKPERADTADKVAPGTAAWDRLRERMQTLLAERFQLAIHKDVKEAAGYALVPARKGPKLQPSHDQGPPRTGRSRGRIEAHGGTMQMLATVLSEYLGRPVADRSGLAETYDYKLEYTQDSGPGASDANPPDFSGPSIFTAIQEPLGLKLESARVETVTIVIDRAEKLSAN